MKSGRKMKEQKDRRNSAEKSFQGFSSKNRKKSFDKEQEKKNNDEALVGFY